MQGPSKDQEAILHSKAVTCTVTTNCPIRAWRHGARWHAKRGAAFDDVRPWKTTLSADKQPGS